jgi:hypothetical protein
MAGDRKADSKSPRVLDLFVDHIAVVPSLNASGDVSRSRERGGMSYQRGKEVSRRSYHGDATMFHEE